MSRGIVARLLTTEEREHLDSLLAPLEGQPGMLLTVLGKIQEHHPQRYLPLEYLGYLAERTGLPASRVLGVATFYSLFNLEPQGKHSLCICRGTACHTRGSQQLLAGTQHKLGLSEAGAEERDAATHATTTARGITVRTVACFGQCALAPVAEIDGRILSRVSERTLERVIDDLTDGHERDG